MATELHNFNVNSKETKIVKCLYILAQSSIQKQAAASMKREEDWDWKGSNEGKIRKDNQV